MSLPLLGLLSADDAYLLASSVDNMPFNTVEI